MVAQQQQPSLTKSVLDIVGFILISAAYVVQAIVKSLLPKSYRTYKDVRGEIALVTGGGGGLGRLLALRLAKLGATVVLWDVNLKGVEETVNLVKSVGGTAYGFKCDLANKDDVYKVAEITKKTVGDVTILINNAGVASGELLLNTSDHMIKKTFDVNIIAHFWTAKAFLPKMMENNHGHIITVASMAGFVGAYKLVDYCASKYAAIGFDEALRVELETQGIFGVKTTAVCPYFIQSTGMFNNINTRFLSTLKPNDVADRIIEAMQREETVVMMPNVFRIGLILRLIMPWSVISMFLRGLIPDVGHNHEKATPQITPVIEEIPKKGNTVRNAVSNLNHRISLNGKNL